MYGKLTLLLFIALASYTSAYKVVFMGASIIQYWDLTKSFPNQDYINKGIAGQTAPQVYARIPSDAIANHPDIVLFQVGSNDIASGKESQADVIKNIEALVQPVRSAGIKVIMSSLLPTRGAMTVQRPNWEINNINDALRQFCSDQGVYYLDFHSAVVGDDGQFRADLTVDGLHPNAQGYSIMAPLATDAINIVG